MLEVSLFEIFAAPLIKARFALLRYWGAWRRRSMVSRDLRMTSTW